MSNPRGKSKLDAQRKWTANNPRQKQPKTEKEKEQQRNRCHEITTAGARYREEARALLAT